MIENKMIDNGFIMCHFYDTFGTIENKRPETKEILDRYECYWPIKSEDIVILLMRRKRIEWLSDEIKNKKLLEENFFICYNELNDIVEKFEIKIGLK